jgi:hypothetical protein
VLDLASTRLRSLLRRGTSVQRAAIIAVVVLALALCGCAAGDPQLTSERPAGFWLGLWHGIISWVTLIVGIFDPSVEVYERNNTGGWYDFGFLLGATSIWGGGSSAGYHRSHRRWRGGRGDRRDADTVV